ncbi:MAG TPA: hypothetical protein VE010_09125 [Thermoanaerobaculia bacterium]|nr:hypothetical protein [Thermoanaerobaculia bacterium]
MDEWWAVVADLVLAGFAGFLIWYVKKFLAAQVEAYASKLGEIQSQVAKIDDLVLIERRLKEATTEIESAASHKLHVDNLARTKELELRERQLSEFFWPLYMHLQMDNAVWERMAQITPHSETRDRLLAAKMEAAFILPNHEKAMQIIEAKRHLAGTDQALEAQLLKYIRHVAVFRALRGLGVTDRDPQHVGEPWPTEFFDIVSKATLQKQQELDALINRRDSASAGESK